MKHIVKFFVIGFLSFQGIVYAATDAQGGTITVSGTIIDKETNETVPFANVMAVKSDGSAINKDAGVLGTTSDMDGKFTLADVPSDAKIKISFVGYTTQTVAANQSLDIKLSPDGIQLAEAEVVAKAIKNGDPCEKTDQQIKKGKYEKNNGKWVCVPTECATDEYEIKNKNCVKKEKKAPETKCSQSQLKSLHATDGKLQDNNCVPTKCEDKYTLTDGKCVLSKDKRKPANKDSERALKDAKKKYEDAKTNEQSTANRTLTAVTTAATGIGGMELAQGLSEQKADKDAEQDMAAYLATFRCEYGNGKSVKGGTTEIELPGGNDSEMMKLRNEYFALAASLKERKEALGMKPGIESEVILDKAQMGLYDDENVGITDGAYASLYRAAMGNEKDQAKLQEMKDTSKKRVVDGAIAVGAGVAVGIVGNSLINGKLGEKIKEAKAEKEAKEKETLALKELQKCLDDGGAKNANRLKFNNFTPSVLSLDEINCSGSEWRNAINKRVAQTLFADTTDAEEVSEKLVESFGESIAADLLGVATGSVATTSEDETSSSETQTQDTDSDDNSSVEQADSEIVTNKSVDTSQEFESEETCKKLLSMRQHGKECYQDSAGKWKIRWTVKEGDPCPVEYCSVHKAVTACKYDQIEEKSFHCAVTACADGYKVIDGMCKKEQTVTCDETKGLYVNAQGDDCWECPKGHIVNNGKCEKCPEDKKPAGNKCIDYTCGASEYKLWGKCETCYNKNSIVKDNKCVACPDTQRAKNNKCVDFTCGPSELKISGKCEKCYNKNNIVKDNKCVACPDTQKAENNKCVDFTCGPSELKISGKCETCYNKNSIVKDNKCVACPDTQKAQNNQCVDFTCPSGKYKSSGECVACNKLYANMVPNADQSGCEPNKTPEVLNAFKQTCSTIGGKLTTSTKCVLSSGTFEDQNKKCENIEKKVKLPVFIGSDDGNKTNYCSIH